MSDALRPENSENKRPALKYEKVREPTMTKLEKVLYTAKAYTTGGRGGGASRTDDGQSAIFLSVIKSCRRQKKVRWPADLAIDAEVDLGTTGEAYGLAAA